MKWTDDQRHVIDYRNRNILVSAAAGSGKTAVLVQRIIERITGQDPVDVDKLLIVTFTKAAAAEMRERIGLALSKCAEEAELLPEGNEDERQKKEAYIENLTKQQTLIHHAQITTIDSFCLNVVRNHFGEIGLDPNFRIADPGEIKLLEKDVLDALFEKNYEREENEAFLRLIDTYGNKRGDDDVRAMVEDIYRQSASAPWQKEWVEGLIDAYSATSDEELLQTDIISNLADYAKNCIREEIAKLEVAKLKAMEPRGPEAYVATLNADIEMLSKFEDCHGYKDMSELFETLSYVRLASVKKGADVEEAKQEIVKSIRDESKKEITKIRDKYFSMPFAEILAQLNRIKPFVEELIRLSLEYIDLLQKKKDEKHMADFNDVEHLALSILVDPVTKEASATAMEFQSTIEEIMIDEYQDSNEVQEAILTSISRMATGSNNMFMVGDVKQSIYRFRQARPELFMEKYDSYSHEESINQRIDLKQNFRSRKEVLDFTNDIFFKIMQKDLGKVSYDSYAALYLGADYYPLASDNEAEFLFLNRKDPLLAEQDDYNKQQLEAVLVADRIHKLMDSKEVYDKNTGELRPIRYSDIVILFRSVKSFGLEFASILENRGIPVHVETSTGYFSAMEVQNVLAFLQILDNPYQDIPMAAVLRSPMVALDNEEMAEIAVLDRDKNFAENALSYCKDAEGKAKEFYEIFEKLRNEVEDTPIHKLIEHLLAYTGYGNYAAALPAGERRFANLNMLIEKAIAYESTSYKGLFHFVRYIETLKKYEVDFGEADVTGESANVVHIMTIHKSKGLEFPVVFVSGMGKKFDVRDINSQMVIHPDLKLGLVERTNNPRVKRSCIVKEQIGNQIRQDNLGEELRVLYVALTRAKEKLIVTGTFADFEKSMGDAKGECRAGVPLPFAVRDGAKTYLDWILPALLSYPDKYHIEPVDAADLVLEETKRKLETEGLRQELQDRIGQVTEEDILALEQKLMFTYPYVIDESKKMKYSVSELKHASMEQNYANATEQLQIPDFAKDEKEATIPRFLSSGKEESNLGGDVVVNRGALRGTAMHRAMECLDFTAILPILGIDTCEEESNLSNKLSHISPEQKKAMKELVDRELNRMLEKELLTQDMVDLINAEKITAFLFTQVACRMAIAQTKGNLFREKPFIMDYEGYLVQGIIDVFWLEENGLIVLDYKTDRVQKAEELVSRYQKQLDLYRDALGRAFANEKHEPMKSEAVIYAFHLQEVVNL